MVAHWSILTLRNPVLSDLFVRCTASVVVLTVALWTVMYHRAVAFAFHWRSASIRELVKSADFCQQKNRFSCRRCRWPAGGSDRCVCPPHESPTRSTKLSQSPVIWKCYASRNYRVTRNRIKVAFYGGLIATFTVRTLVPLWRYWSLYRVHSAAARPQHATFTD